MRANSLILIALMLVSCGEQVVPQEGIDTRIGLTLTADPDDTMSAREVTNLSNICNAITDKEFLFEDRINTNQTVEQTSQVYSRACGQEEFGLEGSVTSTLAESSNGDLVFNAPSGSASSYYKNVLMKSSKQLNDLCDDDADVTTETVRYSISGSYGVWVQVLGNREGACGERMDGENEPDSGTTFCYVVTTAQRSSSDSAYTIRSVELFEVNVEDGTQRGHVVKRSYATSSGCAADDVTRATSQLNSI